MLAAGGRGSFRVEGEEKWPATPIHSILFRLLLKEGEEKEFGYNISKSRDAWIGNSMHVGRHGEVKEGRAHSREGRGYFTNHPPAV